MNSAASELTVFVGGDVMTGRGIDQVLPHPNRPHLFESAVDSALTYVALAERHAGAIPRAVDWSYIWGDALAELERHRPRARIVNLETAVTSSEDAWPAKGIHYRMHPRNVACLSAAALDCCVLANNHVLDWGRSGLQETLATLRAAGIRTAGGGADAEEAAAPAAMALPGSSRLLVFGAALQSSGAPSPWRAGPGRAGINWFAEASAASADRLAQQILAQRHERDVVIVSIHWGGNWGYGISRVERDFAHRLIDRAGAALIHGHSSHHVKGIEVYRRSAILYGCGDLLTDYEGIGGHESYRSDLGLLYFVTLEPQTGALLRLTMSPTRMRRFQIRRAPAAEAAWLCATLDRECRPLGACVVARPDGDLALRWE